MDSDMHMAGIRILGRHALWLDQTEGRFRSYANRSYTTNKARAITAAKWLSSEFQTTKKVSREDEETNKLQKVVEQSQDVLIHTKTVFPFTLFPTHITIDRHKLTIVYRDFFKSEQTVSVPIEDIKNIEADAGPFFGSITVTSDLFINNTQTISYLKRSDVRRVQRLVQGAMVALKEKIDISKVDTKRLCKLLTDLGTGHTTSGVA